MLLRSTLLGDWTHRKMHALESTAVLNEILLAIAATATMTVNCQRCDERFGFVKRTAFGHRISSPPPTPDNAERQRCLVLTIVRRISEAAVGTIVNEDGSRHEDAGGVAPFLCSISLVQSA